MGIWLRPASNLAKGQIGHRELWERVLKPLLGICKWGEPFKALCPNFSFCWWGKPKFREAKELAAGHPGASPRGAEWSG